ncbi:hypothetical protein AURDEDRAFT_131476 [Auricularia subglabra TFB-10046 SS5]|uniref:Uncharacterized protein n=1 Tax=Auricularia subglabra (strain TFB-10046 / SS5) TaxID=717982 RepID=J0WPP6_AURST|nr:hypothetical protein AURDEDRAFT_131476 [Auricularia subglabra TFB-10046 SS5]
MQRSYMGPFVISDDEADSGPSDPAAVLVLLNEIMATDYTAESCPRLFAALQKWIADGCDFGSIYSRVRYCSAASIDMGIEDSAIRLREFEQKRSLALDSSTNRIIHPHLQPRRLWDLISNRVVPHDGSAMLDGAVSHSWMADPQRVDTPINNHEWPVPIPRDATLARVRIELLNLGFKYVWLDVLCLRQKGAPDKESQRLDEWKVDVPTIGAVYHGTAQIVYYYSGLGRPFEVGDLSSERHWINRAWTLQEISSNTIIAGRAASSPVLPSAKERPDSVTEQLYEKIAYLTVHVTSGGESIFPILEAMRFRFGTSELDKVAGLAYRLMARTLPPYIDGQAPDDAWDALVTVMTTNFRGNIFLLFPQPGRGRYTWYPSWGQITDRAVFLPSHDLFAHEPVEYDPSSNGSMRQAVEMGWHSSLLLTVENAH